MRTRTLTVYEYVQQSPLDPLAVIYKAEIERRTDELVTKLRKHIVAAHLEGWTGDEIEVGLRAGGKQGDRLVATAVLRRASDG